MDRLRVMARQYPLATALLLGGAVMIVVAILWALIAKPF